jgi:hypothetical protein
VAAFLFLKALLQLFHELFPAAERLDLGLFLLGQEFLVELAQPFFRNVGEQFFRRQAFQALEDVAEDAVELVEVALVLHQRGAGEVVEVLDLEAGEVLLHRLHQGQVFLQRGGHAGGFQLVEEGCEHGTAYSRDWQA